MPTKTYTDKQKAAYWKKKASACPSTTRRTRPVRGRGFYKGFARDAGTVLGAAGGGFVAGIPGALAGANFGSSLGSAISNITGRGLYNTSTLRKNSLVLPVNPRIKNDLEREGAVVISHREHIGTIKSSTGFQLQYELPLNAAQNATFPWLSAVASEFTQWEPLGIIFEYVSTSGNAVSSTNNALGEVIMTVNANSLDSSYVSKTQMLNSDFAQAFAPSSNGMCAVECSPQQSTLTKLYTRYGAVKPSADIRMSDLGVLSIATSGMQAADIEVGELYVNYQVALFKPQLVQELGLLIPQAVYSLVGAVAASPLGTSQTKQVDTIGVVFDSATKLTIPRNTSGKFHLNINYQGSAAALVRFTITYVNATGISAFRAGTQSFVDDTGNTADTYLADYAFVVDDPSKEVTITLGTGATLPTTISSADLMITQYNWDITS